VISLRRHVERRERAKYTAGHSAPSGYLSVSAGESSITTP
jgi:hypothetical protein